MADVCQLTTLAAALASFAYPLDKTQSSRHIRPLHWYVACRLVIEGGFDPDDITPHPPLRVKRLGGGRPPLLEYSEEAAAGGERAVLGGLKTKDVDVVVCKEGIGPVIAVSLKGTHNAFRNLTNRMEEAAGDCTNLHMAYPSLVYAFWHLLRANDDGDAAPVAHFELSEAGRYKTPDIAVTAQGELAEGVDRYVRALWRLSGREDLRESPSRYEACSVSLVDVLGGRPASIGMYRSGLLEDISYFSLFERLYTLYDQRYVYQAPQLANVTRRMVWAAESGFVREHCDGEGRFSDYGARVA